MYIVYIEREDVIKEFCYNNNYEFVDENGYFWDMYFKKEGESNE